jgi:hypothetical protein
VEGKWTKKNSNKAMTARIAGAQEKLVRKTAQRVKAQVK